MFNYDNKQIYALTYSPVRDHLKFISSAAKIIVHLQLSHGTPKLVLPQDCHEHKLVSYQSEMVRISLAYNRMWLAPTGTLCFRLEM